MREATRDHATAPAALRAALQDALAAKAA